MYFSEEPHSIYVSFNIKSLTMLTSVKSRFSTIYPLLPVMIPVVIAIVYIIQPHFDWGDDAGLYIMQAKCLVDGTSLKHLYEMNKYMMQHSITELGPYLYPMGTPILLSAIISLFGLNFLAMKIMCAIFLIASIPVMYHIFYKYLNDRRASVFGLLLIYLNIYYIKEADSINSDIPFLFLSILALYAMDKGMTMIRGVLLGLLVFACYITRDIGLFLLPALFVKQIVDHVFSEKQTNIRIQIIPYVVFAVMFGVQKSLIPYGQENHYQMLFENLGPALFLKNIYYYKIQIGRYFINGDIWTTLLVPMLFLTSAGMFLQWKRSPHIIVFTFLVLSILMLWPHYQGPRLILPAIPFLILYTIIGLQKVSGLLKYGSLISHTMATALILFVTYQNARFLYQYHQRTSDMNYIQSTDNTIQYIRKNIADTDIVGFRDPRALTMHTGKKAIFTDLNHFDSSVANYLLIRDTGYTHEKYPIYKNYKLGGAYLLLEKK